MCEYFREVESNVWMFLLGICVFVWRGLIICVVLWNFFCLKPKGSTRHERFDGEGGTLKFSCVKVFDYIDAYLCFIAGLCERERSRPLPHSAHQFPLCVCVCVQCSASVSAAPERQ